MQLGNPISGSKFHIETDQNHTKNDPRGFHRKGVALKKSQGELILRQALDAGIERCFLND
jgi:hypothetical protein